MAAEDMLTRGLRVLGALADHPDGAGVSRVAAACGLPVSTAHRLLGVLAAERFVVYDADTRRYALGLRALELARGFNHSSGGYQVAFEPMRRIARETGLPAIAGVLSGTDVVLVLAVEGRQHLQLRSAIGTHNPWHATALGKAIVAHLDAAERDRLCAGPLAAVTPRTRTDPDALRAELDEARERGWAAVDEENEIGVRAVAVPVLDPEGSPPRLALSLGATVSLTGRAELYGHVPLLREAAREIALRMSASGTVPA